MRHDHIVQGNSLVGQLPFWFDYMIWYHDITRLLIGNPSHHPEYGFHTSAPTEFWGQCMAHIYHLSADALQSAPTDNPLVSILGSIRSISAQALTLVGENRRITVHISQMADTQE